MHYLNDMVLLEVLTDERLDRKVKTHEKHLMTNIGVLTTLDD